MLGWMNHKLESRLLGEISITTDMHRCLYRSFSPLLFAFLLFTAILRPPQIGILLFCISFPWGWSWSLSAVQCHEPHSIVHQALYLSFLVPYIYFSLPLYNQGIWFRSYLNGLVVFPTVFNFSLNLAVRSFNTILLFTASDLASITSHIHSWELFLRWLHPFILSGVIAPLISSSTMGTSKVRGSSREELPHLQGQGRQPWRDTPHV